MHSSESKKPKPLVRKYFKVLVVGRSMRGLRISVYPSRQNVISRALFQLQILVPKTRMKCRHTHTKEVWYHDSGGTR
jgi:hypothetical protein